MLGEGLLNTVGLGMIYSIIVLIILLFFLVEVLKRMDRFKIARPKTRKHRKAPKVITKKIKVRTVAKSKS